LAGTGGLFVGWLAGAGCATPRKGPDEQLIAQAWNIIQAHYVDRSAVKPTELTYGAISGMVDALGDTGHSTVLTPGMLRHLKEAEHGELKGIGVELQVKDGRVVVVAPLDNSPAQRAGLRPGDIILKVNGEDISDWPIGRVIERITGPTGTPVNLTFLEPHGGHTRQVRIVRAAIHLHEATWCTLPGTRIAHLRIAAFDGGATKELRSALAEIQGGPAKGIILDLRNNPGGLLEEAVGVASQFLAGGNVLLAKDAHGHVNPVPVEKGGIATNIALAVLINEGTASAAEIVAGALRDAHRGILVGETTFGTGTVLEQFRLSDGSALLLAIEEWSTPNGQSFWHKGLAPQVAVTLPDEAEPLTPNAERDMTPSQLQSNNDRQLLRAQELLENSGQLEKAAQF